VEIFIYNTVNKIIMDRKKRGALELSITTIVIVVIGITILTLGLVFTKGIFGKLTSLSDEVFGKGSTIIDTLSIDAKISVPSSVIVQQGKSTTFKVQVGHDGTLSGQRTFSLQLTPRPPTGYPTGVVEARVISEPSVTLNEGQQATFVVQVATTTSAPLSSGLGRTPAYGITITTSGQSAPYATSAFVVNIEKGRGLF